MHADVTMVMGPATIDGCDKTPARFAFRNHSQPLTHTFSNRCEAARHLINIITPCEMISSGNSSTRSEFAALLPGGISMD